MKLHQIRRKKYISIPKVFVIFVDYREPETVVKKLEEVGLNVKVRRLEVGDYLIVYKSFEVAVERKTVSDFENSIIDGRLFDQIHRLSKSYNLSFVCIIGESEKNLEKIDKRAFIGSLIGIALTGVVPVQLSELEDFCLFLKYLNKQIENEKLRVYPRIVKKAEIEDSIAMLTAIPGIGVEKAKRLLERFGSVHGVVNASIVDLMKVEGIGEKQAKRIYYFVRGKKIKV